MLLRYAVSNHPSPHQSTELVERWTDYLDIWGINIDFATDKKKIADQP